MKLEAPWRALLAGLAQRQAGGSRSRTGSTRQTAQDRKGCAQELSFSLLEQRSGPVPLSILVCVCEGPCVPVGLLLGIARRRASLPARGVGQPGGLPGSAVAAVGDDSLLMAISSLANFSAS